MLTRYTLSCIAVVGVLNGCAPNAASAAPDTVDDWLQVTAGHTECTSFDSASLPLSGHSADNGSGQPQSSSDAASAQQNSAVTAAIDDLISQVPQDGSEIQPMAQVSGDTRAAETTHSLSQDTEITVSPGTGQSSPAANAVEHVNAATVSTQKTPDAINTEAAPAQKTPDAVNAATASTQKTPDAINTEAASAQKTPDAVNAATASTQNPPVELSGTTIQSAPVELSGPPVQSAPAVPVIIQPKSEQVASSRIAISHSLAHSDDGSSIIVTVDGNDAGMLRRGGITALEVKPGKHKIGGYVRTLFGMGRVTIPAVEVIADRGTVTRVDYTVIKDKPGFKVIERKQS